jgi:iron complex outermembrane receptor protein
MHDFKPGRMALALLAVLGTAHAQQSSDLGTISVTGEGDKLGTGLLIDEDTPKAKSTVTKAQIEKTRSSSNPFQALSLLPGVNSFSQDATGLFGANLRVRGFNSDQMGFTVDGAPVNDSGSFGVFPQEYADAENMCEMFVTQGATDTEAPHVGASGGNVSLVTCDPEDQQRVRIAASGGQLHYARSYVRVDTGKLGDFKGFVSYSRSQVDKWRGAGSTDRDHVDAKVQYDLGRGSQLSAGLLYNRAFTNNFRNLTLTELASEGYNADFALTPPQHLAPVNGTAQVESSPGPAYYGYALNPFENYLLTASAHIQLNERARLDVAPYFWYGYGTGGVQQTTVAESGNSGTRLHSGIADINGDGDTLDTVLVYRGSLTETHRPGVSVQLSYTLEGHKLLTGVWFERARHRQTQPASRVDNAGNIGDPWLDNDSALVHYNDGALYQGRNQNTVSTGKSVFVQDTMDLLGSKLRATPALSFRQIDRDFSNYANSGANQGGDYRLERSYSKLLPSLGLSYQFDDRLQGFASLSKNFKAPGNFEYQGAVRTTGTPVFVDGVLTNYSASPRNNPRPETSVNLDVGTRYRGSWYKLSATAFYVDFKDRIASGFSPTEGGRFDINVGKSIVKGLEVEAGTEPVNGFSAYVSGSYTRSTIEEDLPVAAGVTVPTAGKQFPDTPKGMAAAALQYASGPYLVNLTGKYTSTRALTLTNDQAIPGFTSFDLNAAWKLPDPKDTGFKNPVLRLNITNLTDKQYQFANSGSGSLIAIGNGIGGLASVYTGAPRFTSLTFQVDY